MKLALAWLIVAGTVLTGASCNGTSEGPDDDPRAPQYRIAFAGDGSCGTGGLDILSEDSSAYIKGTCTDVRWPQWTPDGATIVFVAVSAWQIVAYDVATGASRILIDLENVNGITSISLSSNGSKALFAVDGSIGGIVYTIDLVTGDTVSLRRGGDEPTFAWLRQAQWSPAGDRILFVADYRAWTMAANGSNLRPVTDSVEMCSDASWSPTGDRIAVTTTTVGGLDEIFTLRSDGSDRINVSNHAKSDRDARWSPDGTLLAFVSMRSDTSMLVVCSPTGNDLRPVTSAAADKQYAWSPSSDRLALTKYINTPSGLRQQLVIVQVHNPTPKHAVKTVHDAWWPSWSPVKL